MATTELQDVQSVRYEHANDLRNAEKYDYIYDCTGCMCCCGCPECAQSRLYENAYWWESNWGSG